MVPSSIRASAWRSDWFTGVGGVPGKPGGNATGGGGRTMSGGIDARAMEIPRKIFAAARNIGRRMNEFKVVVVQAIKSLALKFPRKHGILMNFLSSMLRDEGGLKGK